MATRRTAALETREPTAPKPEHPTAKALLEQYECGPIAFSGVPGALYERHVVFDHVVRPDQSDPRQRFEAVAQALRDVLSQRWLKTDATYDCANPKQVYYLSMEFLIGRSLASNVLNLRVEPVMREAMEREKLDWDQLVEMEPDAGLGNGGLGRLAACFLDSMATLSLPAIGYGLRYEYGIFRQEIADGRQVEHPDHWLRRPDPWEVSRPREAVDVGLNCAFQAKGRASSSWSATCRRPLSAHLTTGRSSATAAGPSTRCGSGARRRITISTSWNSAEVISSTPSTRKLLPSRSRGSSTLTTRRPAAKACGSSRSISWSPARWLISSRGSAAAATTGQHSLKRSRSSSTTRTLRSPSPS